MEPPISTNIHSAENERAALELGFTAREPWAFEAAYISYAGLLTGAAYGVLRDPQAAEDCVHDVLARLWSEGHAYRRARGALSHFLAICVRNEALSRARRDANRAKIERRIATPEAYLDELVDPFERARIERAIAHLSEERREIVMCSYFGGLTHEEIAQQLGIPVGTVKSRLASALRTLRTTLRSEDTP